MALTFYRRGSVQLFVRKYPKVAVALLVFVAMGAALVMLTRAAVTVRSLEAERGTQSSNVKPLANTTASGGAGSKFTNGLSCVYTAPTSADQWGGMTYVNYHFNVPDIYQVEHEVDLLENPSGTNSHFYIQMYDADIGASGQYYGLQTTGTVIWSRWNTNDTSNIRSSSGATILNGVETGANFISLRKKFGSLPNGHYKTRITRAEFDGIGDWFGYYVTFPGQQEQYIGDIRFPRRIAGVPASFNDGGGQWNEFWDNNGTSLVPVPLLKLNIKAVANGSLAAVHTEGSYQKMPNSDMYAITPGGYVHHDIGSMTPRCHFPDNSGYIKLW